MQATRQENLDTSPKNPKTSSQEKSDKNEDQQSKGTQFFHLGNYQSLYRKIKLHTDPPEEWADAENVFILFIQKTDDGIDPFSKEVQGACETYIECLAGPIKDRLKLITCEVHEEETHRISLSRINPWTVIEGVTSLPALVRLDGAKYLSGNELTDLIKLDLAFGGNQKLKFKKSTNQLIQDEKLVKPHWVLLSLEHGGCQQHKNINIKKSSKKIIEEDSISCLDINIETEAYNPRKKHLYYEQHTYEVERMIIEKPPESVEVPVLKDVKPLKKGKKKKGKGKKKKGKKKGNTKGKKKKSFLKIIK